MEYAEVPGVATGSAEYAKAQHYVARDTDERNPKRKRESAPSFSREEAHAIHSTLVVYLFTSYVTHLVSPVSSTHVVETEETRQLLAKMKAIAESPTSSFPDVVSLSKWLLELRGSIATYEMRARASLAAREVLLGIYREASGRVVVPGPITPATAEADDDSIQIITESPVVTEDSPMSEAD